MEKKEVVEILKKHGLDIAESQLTSLINGLFDAIPELVMSTENKYDDMLIPLLAVIKPALLSLVDQIDGEEG